MRDRRLDHVEFRRRRLAAGLTQKQLADDAGVSVSYVKLLESGSGTKPSWPYVLVLSEAMHCKPEAFMRPVPKAAAKSSVKTGDAA